MKCFVNCNSRVIFGISNQNKHMNTLANIHIGHPITLAISIAVAVMCIVCMIAVNRSSK